MVSVMKTKHNNKKKAKTKLSKKLKLFNPFTKAGPATYFRTMAIELSELIVANSKKHPDCYAKEDGKYILSKAKHLMHKYGDVKG